MRRRKIVSGLLGAIVVVGSATWFLKPAVAIPVFDAANYAESVTIAARTLAQINNQIQQLQNEATVLANMARNLQNLNVNSVTQLTTELQQVDALLLKAQGITFNINTTTSSFQTMYPQQYSAAVTSNQLVQDARTRWLASMNAFQNTMSVQSQVVQNVQADEPVLNALVAASQGAVGSLQAQQATNQLLALSTKQQLQLQSMMAVQFRAQAAEQARAATGQVQGQAATQKFLGSSQFYPGN